MDEGRFYHRACVGSGLTALDRIGHLLNVVARAEDPSEILDRAPAPGMFTAGEQIDTAIGFTLRLALPPAARTPPAARDAAGLEALRMRRDAAEAELRALTPADYDSAGSRRIRHIAGFADLDQEVADYVFAFALPNLNFHLTAAYIALKQAGLPLGKADFDGLHAYPPEFTF